MTTLFASCLVLLGLSQVPNQGATGSQQATASGPLEQALEGLLATAQRFGGPRSYELGQRNAVFGVETIAGRRLLQALTSADTKPIEPNEIAKWLDEVDKQDGVDRTIKYNNDPHATQLTRTDVFSCAFHPERTSQSSLTDPLAPAYLRTSQLLVVYYPAENRLDFGANAPGLGLFTPQTILGWLPCSESHVQSFRSGEWKILATEEKSNAYEWRRSKASVDRWVYIVRTGPTTLPVSVCWYPDGKSTHPHDAMFLGYSAATGDFPSHCVRLIEEDKTISVVEHTVWMSTQATDPKSIKLAVGGPPKLIRDVRDPAHVKALEMSSLPEEWASLVLVSNHGTERSK